MPKYHYWTPFEQQDDDEASLSTTTPLVTSVAATRRVDDTAIRVLLWARVAATVGPTSLPNLDWLAAATCDVLVNFDEGSTGAPVNIMDDNPNIMGFVRLEQTMWLTPTANKYIALWQGPVAGLNLEGQRRGTGDLAPAVSVQRWVEDNHGVFDNVSGFGVLFSSRIVGRVLWASDQAP